LRCRRDADLLRRCAALGDNGHERKQQSQAHAQWR
jgi:hypothetical protein